MIQKEVFMAIESLSLENSFGTINEQRDVELEVTLVIKDAEYGYFEFYDDETGGDHWYAEGGIWFQGTTVTDYDGVFALPRFIIKKLQEWGYDTSEVE